MKLIQIAKRGPDKELSPESWHSATKNPATGKTEKVCLWFQNPNPADFQNSRYRVEMNRADANRLRDFLNTMLPEAGDESGPAITQAMQDRLAWKEGEYAYCVNLCRTAGNVAVPPPSVKDYLFLQSCLADKAGETAISIALWGAAEMLEDSPGRFSRAFVYLVEQREKIAGDESGPTLGTVLDRRKNLS